MNLKIREPTQDNAGQAVPGSSQALEFHLVIRELVEADCERISTAFALQGWDKPAGQQRRYLSEQQAGKRVALVAETDGEFAGYVTLVWESDYLPFREVGIPEIVDFNVVKKFQRLGIGSALMDEIERRAAQRSDVVGLGVGLTADYGAAQILYALRGYIPDGRGLFQYGQHLTYGNTALVDDLLGLYMTRRLR